MRCKEHGVMRKLFNTRIMLRKSERMDTTGTQNYGSTPYLLIRRVGIAVQQSTYVHRLSPSMKHSSTNHRCGFAARPVSAAVVVVCQRLDADFDRLAPLEGSTADQT